MSEGPLVPALDGLTHFCIPSRTSIMSFSEADSDQGQLNQRTAKSSGHTSLDFFRSFVQHAHHTSKQNSVTTCIIQNKGVTLGTTYDKQLIMHLTYPFLRPEVSILLLD